MRPTLVLLAAVVATASPAAARPRVCDDGCTLVVRGGPEIRTLRSVPARVETVWVRRTRLVPRVVYVPRTRLEPLTIVVPRVTRRVAFDAAPAPGAVLPAGYGFGAVYVPPGQSYPCLLGTIGCDSGAVAPVGE